jgi:curved DNA-binding protein CbpA
MTDPITTAFAELDLEPEASADEVRSAYRTKIKEAHPDHGGDREEFKRLQDAYATAQDHANAEAGAVEA